MDLNHMKIMFAASTLLVTSLCAFVSDGSAQDRLPPIPADKLTEAQKKAASEFEANRKQPIFGPFVPLSRSPQLMLAAERMGNKVRFDNSLPRDVSEFAILLISRRMTQQYEWYIHAADGRTAGLSEAIIQAVADGRRPENMSEGQEIVYEFSQELNDFHSVTDRTYARMVAKFGEQGVMDFIGLNGYYSFISMVLNVARTPLPPGNTPALRPFPK
jgi:4-carboxymuconolactone decarboxylase